MSNTHVLLRIDPADAVRALSPYSGLIEVPLSREMLEQLTDAQREALARCGALNASKVNANKYSWLEGASTPDLTGIQTALNLCIEERNAAKAKKEQKEKKEQEEIKRALSSLNEKPLDEFILYNYGTHTWSLGNFWNQTFNSKVIKELPEFSEELKKVIQEIDKRNALYFEEQERLRQKDLEIYRRQEEQRKAAEEKRLEQRSLYLAALKAFVDQHGDVNQIERQTHHVLPRKEAEALVRGHFFSVFEGCAAYEKIKAEEVLAATDYEYAQNELVDFEIDTAHALTAEQWEKFKAFKDLAKTSKGEMTCKPQAHCGKYDDETVIVRYSVKVSFVWHGEEFHKTYAL